jgi:hypothetical protein
MLDVAQGETTIASIVLETAGGRGRELATNRRAREADVTKLWPRALGKLHRFHIELVLAITSAVLGVATLAAPTWLERGTGLDPDFGSGHLEWAVAGVFAAMALAAALSARSHYRQLFPREDLDGSAAEVEVRLPVIRAPRAPDGKPRRDDRA